jgi:hypothetical protein
VHFIPKSQCQKNGDASDCNVYLFLSALMHLVTTARIQLSSDSVAPLALLGGGWKATFLPSWRGSCFANASLRAFGSRENGTGEGPTDARAGRVIDMFLPEGCETGTGVPEGEGARGRLFMRLSKGI